MRHDLHNSPATDADAACPADAAGVGANPLRVDLQAVVFEVCARDHGGCSCRERRVNLAAVGFGAQPRGVRCDDRYNVALAVLCALVRAGGDEAAVKTATALAPARPTAGAVEAGIYMASKAIHAPRWRELRAAGWPIISTWIDEAEAGRTTDWADLWDRCASEPARVAVTVLYAEDGEALKGALVEVGAALSHGRRVIVVGPVDHTWLQNRNVHRAADLSEARELWWPWIVAAKQTAPSWKTSDIHRVRAALKALHDIAADRVGLDDGPAWAALEEAHSAWLWSTPEDDAAAPQPPSPAARGPSGADGAPVGGGADRG